MLQSRIKKIFAMTVLVLSSFLVINNSRLNALDIEMTDSQAPSIPVITTNPTYIADSWTNKITVVTATGSTDDITANEDIIYEISLDGATYNEGNSVTLTQTGNYTIYFKVTDEAENSAVTNKTIKLDLIAPQAPYILMNAGVTPYVSNTWVNMAVNIKIYGAVDTGGSDLAGYQYKIGEGAWTNGDLYTFSISGDYLLYFRSIDNAGNVSATGLRNIKVDLEGPRAFTLQTNITTIDSIYVTGTTVDDLSGMATVAYRLNDGRVWSSWRSAVEDWLTGYNRGQQVTLIVESRDNAGNITVSQTTVKTLANTIPVAIKDTFNMKSNVGKILLELLKNDYDDDNGDSIKIVAISKLSNPLAGKLYLENGNVLFEPAENFGGNVSFEYTLEDGYVGKSTGIVEMVVTAVAKIIEEPIEEERQLLSEPIFSDICIIGLIIGAILILINYIIHRAFFNEKPIRIILQITSALIVFPLLCFLRISLGYVFSFTIMVVYIVTSYIYATLGKDKK
ncbi:MAG: fibronectin type III domain-containing protein [Fusobacteria bacterium]|nr:MAG: fibronectin type III domain-containing protein [Fusobacteriota bacterium]KAF0230202.1 MAG: fibronectin type III domain-containing [Fusobacteriota bacterium]